MNSESSSMYFFCICEQVHNKPLPLVEYVLLTLIQQKNHSLNCLSTCLNQFTCVVTLSSLSCAENDAPRISSTAALLMVDPPTHTDMCSSDAV